MASVVIPITTDGEGNVPKQDKKAPSYLHSIINSCSGMIPKNLDKKKLTHSIKVGISLVLVSLLYLLNPLFAQVGQNAMWAIMTVVVIFEYFAGATLGKGINRGIGTVLGGALGCAAAVLAQEIGGVGNSVIVGASVFIFGAGATYCRMIPSIKRRYDYGAMIFILTFNLVAVSGLRAGEVMAIARQRLSTIAMGFIICIFISLTVFPNWASDELHQSVGAKFEQLAHSIEGCFEEYFDPAPEKEKQGRTSCDCKSILLSKAKDESLVNFAKWEPWHGKFGFSYPWDKYLQIGEQLRDLAAATVSLKDCLQSPKQPTAESRQWMKETCQEVVSSLAWTLREIGNDFRNMKRYRMEALIQQKLKTVRVEMSPIMSPSMLRQFQSDEELAVACFIFLLTAIIEKVEELAKEVDELGEIAGFTAQQQDFVKP